jgi:arginine deiminase
MLMAHQDVVSADPDEWTYPPFDGVIACGFVWGLGRLDIKNRAAERVTAAVTTKDRAHIHLDTVFTFLDRDVVTAFPSVVPHIRAVSLRPGKKHGDFHVTEEKDFLSAVADS